MCCVDTPPFGIRRIRSNKELQIMYKDIDTMSDNKITRMDGWDMLIKRPHKITKIAFDYKKTF